MNTVTDVRHMLYKCHVKGAQKLNIPRCVSQTARRSYTYTNTNKQLYTRLSVLTHH